MSYPHPARLLRATLSCGGQTVQRIQGRLVGSILFAAALLAVLPGAASAQGVRVRDLTIQEQSVPVRLMGYGLVVGLDGTGDRTSSSGRSGHTVRSVANLLRRFEVEVPEEMLTMRNVAAVLVTAEISPYLRPGGRFEIHVASVGDARSVRGGVLWMTPLVAEAGGDAVATAQGALLVSDGNTGRGSYTVETTARIPTGGILEMDMPRPAFASANRLLLRSPDLETAARIATAVNGALGGAMAAVEDPGSVALTLPDDPAARVTALSQIGEVRIEVQSANRLVIDGRDGTVVVGGDLAIGNAVVSHGAVTLTIGGAAAGAEVPGSVRVDTGTPAQDVAVALQALQTPPMEIAAIFESLREVGAIAAEIVIR
jgi:flagellar P-ring protein FlgI